MAVLQHPSGKARSSDEDSGDVLHAAARSRIGVLLMTVEMPPRVVYANPAALTLLGCSAVDLALPEGSPLRALLADWVSRSSDADFSFETTLPAAVEATPALIRATSVEVGGESLEAFFIQRTQALEERSRLEQHQRRFRSLIESAQEAVWITERQRLLYANPAAISLFDAGSLGELVGTDLRKFLHPDDHAELERRFEQLRLGARHVAFECRARSRLVPWMTLEVSAITIDYEGHAATLAFARNVTEQKELERRIRQHDRLAALGMLAGGIAHAINNPLSYVLLNLDHLAKELPRLEQEPAFRDEALTLVQQSYAGAERMAGVVRRMREFCRVEESEPGPVDLHATVEAVVEMVGNEIRHRGTLIAELAETAPVFGARARLEQALLSLLIFVARSLPEREHASNEVHVRLQQENNRVLVEVRCSCPHSPSLERLTPGSEAADLGLLACTGIIAASGGTMTVEGDSGPTLFRISLPAAKRAG